MSALLALRSGWHRLATQFRLEAPLQGERFRFASGSIGAGVLPVSYSNCLFSTVNESGFSLSILFPFRLLSPPLFIPWRAVKSVEPRQRLWATVTMVQLGGEWPPIGLRGLLGEKIQQSYARSRNEGSALTNRSTGPR